jgi:hypothetical protein
LSEFDEELFSIAKTAIGAEHELTPQQSARLRGQTAKELRDDARAMRGELGMPSLDDRPRDQSGRFAASDSSKNARVNDIIREAAGR